ncbi:hypothetical protein [Sphingomonas endolithica]|uniref:hypothetical protein n=1 Tax=Sphingomonas endolithica TaxID=2972485 RepID=UPI0021AE661E|nr:hypothetical protein [Sphingomonas sp. ZFBP2030]
MPMLMTALILAQTAMGHPNTPETPEPVCVRAGDLPREFAAWDAPAAARLAVGRPSILRAQSPSAIRWAVRGKAGNGALASFTVARAGPYRIGLSNAARVDVVRGGKALESIAHGHGPICTGLRKIVDFTLPRGTYVLQLSGMPADETKVMIAAK